MKQTAVVFVTDRGFLVPSLVAALQVLQQADVAAIADVVIILIDLDDGRIDELRQIMEGTGLRLFKMESRLFLPPDSTFFNRSHVPKTTLARLALHEVLPGHYENIVYLDGDIQITGSIAPLVRHTVKDGFIAAGADGIWLCRGDIGAFWPAKAAYLADLGITDAINYFNAGVLAFRMDTWRDMAPKALDFFGRNPRLCHYHDQSALNAVFVGRLEKLSPIYNFVSLCGELDMSAEVQPRIIHFTGGDKPWNHAGPPWHGRFLETYRAFLRRYPELAADLDTRPSDKEPPRKTISTVFKDAVLLPWRRFKRRARLRNYLKTGQFAFRD
jgi:lipopolysaccharide biosynthesis glycosyltransferase